MFKNPRGLLQRGPGQITNVCLIVWGQCISGPATPMTSKVTPLVHYALYNADNCKCSQSCCVGQWLYIIIIVYHSLFSFGDAEALTWLQYRSDHHSDSGSQGRNLANDSGNNLTILRKGHHAIFNVHQLMLLDRTPVSRPPEGRRSHWLITLPVKHRDESL